MCSKVMDFLTDDDFINYVLGVTPQSASQWETYFREHPEEMADAEEVNAIAPTDVEDDYMEEEQRQNEFSLVKRLLDQLSPRQREALTLYYIEEKKYEDICEIMNMNYQSVRNLMYRGLTKLRSLAS